MREACWKLSANGLDGSPSLPVLLLTINPADECVNVQVAAQNTAPHRSKGMSQTAVLAALSLGSLPSCVVVWW
jgi:hypothetical protein